jgi:hypothetical protein
MKRDAGAGVGPWRGVLLGAFSSAASGGRCARAFRPNSRRFGFFGSLLLRMSIALAGFYFVGRRSLGAAAGCVCSDSSSARLIVTRLTRPRSNTTAPAKEAGHAP